MDTTTVYFTQMMLGLVSSVSGGITTMLASVAPATPRGIAVDATSVYFATGNSGTVMKCPSPVAPAARRARERTGYTARHRRGRDERVLAQLAPAHVDEVCDERLRRDSRPTLLSTAAGNRFDRRRRGARLPGHGRRHRAAMPITEGLVKTVAAGLLNAASVAVVGTTIYWVYASIGTVNLAK
jgi:hypothetical protein